MTRSNKKFRTRGAVDVSTVRRFVVCALVTGGALGGFGPVGLNGPATNDPSWFVPRQAVAQTAAPRAAELTAASSPENATRAMNLSRTLMSPYCPGRTLQACPSGKATEWRSDIREMVNDGMSNPDIIATLQARVPGFALEGKPPGNKGAFLVIFVLGVAALGLWFAVKKAVGQKPKGQPDTAEEGGPDSGHVASAAASLAMAGGRRRRGDPPRHGPARHGPARHHPGRRAAGRAGRQAAGRVGPAGIAGCVNPDGHQKAPGTREVARGFLIRIFPEGSVFVKFSRWCRPQPFWAAKLFMKSARAWQPSCGMAL